MVFEYSPTKGEIKVVETSASQDMLSKESKAFLLALMIPGNEAYARLPESGGTVHVDNELFPNAVEELLHRVDGVDVE
jgi:hypothetical protein